MERLKLQDACLSYMPSTFTSYIRPFSAMQLRRSYAAAALWLYIVFYVFIKLNIKKYL